MKALKISVRFFEVSGELHQRDDMLKYMRNMDAIGSIYFNFRLQKTLGLWVATNYDERLKVSCDFGVTELFAHDYSKEIKNNADNGVIEKIIVHWKINAS